MISVYHVRKPSSSNMKWFKLGILPCSMRQVAQKVDNFKMYERDSFNPFLVRSCLWCQANESLNVMIHAACGTGTDCASCGTGSDCASCGTGSDCVSLDPSPQGTTRRTFLLVKLKYCWDLSSSPCSAQTRG